MRARARARVRVRVRVRARVRMYVSACVRADARLCVCARIISQLNESYVSSNES